MSHVMNCKISSPSLKLKHFKVFSCVLESLDIYAKNLVSFKYLGVVQKISFKYTPQPFARPHAYYIIKSLFQPPSYIFQLETIVLDIGTRLVYKSNFLLPPTPLFIFERKNIETKEESLSIFVVI